MSKAVVLVQLNRKIKKKVSIEAHQDKLSDAGLAMKKFTKREGKNIKVINKK